MSDCAKPGCGAPGTPGRPPCSDADCPHRTLTYEQHKRVVDRLVTEGKNNVRTGSMLRAGALKLAVYQVKDPETGEYGPRQFHATFDNTVLGLMGVQSAKLFAKFVNDELERNP